MCAAGRYTFIQLSSKNNISVQNNYIKNWNNIKESCGSNNECGELVKGGSGTVGALVQID